MKRPMKLIAVAAAMLGCALASPAQQFGSMEWAMGMAQNMMQNAFQIYHYVSNDGSGIIIDPTSKLMTYCESDKRSTLPFYETTRNGNKAYVSPYRNITAYQVTQNNQSYLLVSYDSRADTKMYYYIGRDNKVDSYLRTPNTPLKEVFATSASQHWQAQSQMQSSSPTYTPAPSSAGGYSSSSSSSSQTTSATVVNRQGYQHAYDGYVDMLISMKNGTYPYQNGFKYSDMVDIQNKMRALRQEWNSAHPDLPIDASFMESWNGSR